MRQWLGTVSVLPKPSVNDPQGLAVRDGLHGLGFEEVQTVRVGRQIEVSLSADSREHAERLLDDMSAQLLANQQIEYYTVQLREAEA